MENVHFKYAQHITLDSYINALYSLIVNLIIGLMTDASLGGGQIVWLTFVSIILSFQAISLTTTSAGVIYYQWSWYYRCNYDYQ